MFDLNFIIRDFYGTCYLSIENGSNVDFLYLGDCYYIARSSKKFMILRVYLENVGRIW